MGCFQFCINGWYFLANILGEWSARHPEYGDPLCVQAYVVFSKDLNSYKLSLLLPKSTEFLLYN